MKRLAVLAVIIVALSLFVVWIAGNSLSMPDTHAESARLVTNVLLAILLLTTLVLGWRGTMGEAFRHGSVWFIAFFAIILAYSYRDELAPMAERVAGELNPAKPVARQANEVVLRRANDGHFYADLKINGSSMRLLADTGASVIALSVEDAEDAGIDVNQLDFTLRVSTANGTAMAAKVELDEVRIGSIIRDDVTALVAKGLSQSLLGMNFFNSLSKFQIENDELLLRD
ncbi:MAG: TIGR02281 family clan AA aspartic protease [Alphaproteobacteria bacterium]|nr:TIGR02281 family clan AA aspartic protease [Alphaproteobacteria bacterium]